MTELSVHHSGSIHSTTSIQPTGQGRKKARAARCLFVKSHKHAVVLVFDNTLIDSRHTFLA